MEILVDKYEYIFNKKEINNINYILIYYKILH